MAIPARAAHLSWPGAIGTIVLCLVGTGCPGSNKGTADAGASSDGSRLATKPDGKPADAAIPVDAIGQASKPDGKPSDAATKPDGKPSDAAIPVDAAKQATDLSGKPADSATTDAPKPQADARPPTDAVVDAPVRPQFEGGTNMCNTPADCALAGACPADAVAGCTCVSVPQQGKTCLARCFAASDCPASSETVFACSAAGLCIPKSQITLDAGPTKRPPDAKIETDAVDDAVDDAADAL